VSETGTQAIQDYLDNEDEQAAASTTAAQNRDTVSPQGQLKAQQTSAVTNNTTSALGNNPIAATGTDIINSTVTTATQSLVSGALAQASGALKPLQTASDAFFTTLATISTASVEIAMELARGNARLIITNINQKEAVITQLKTEATALYNAVALILNSQPFFTPYLQKLVQAYQLITQADNELKSVVSALNPVNANPTFNGTLFNQAMALLNQAEALILPDPSANISSIRSGVLSTASNSITQAKNSLASAMAITGISAQIAKLMVQYASLTLEINTLIGLFLTALSSFISTYKRNSNVDNATINCINSGTAQLDALLAKMQPLLYPTNDVRGQVFFPVNVTSNATVWGIQLQAIIQWLNLTPASAATALNSTSQSVLLYNQASTLLNNQGNITNGFATLLATAAQENFLNTGNQVVQILFDANTVLATTQNPRNVLAEMQKFIDLMTASHILDQDIINALTPFINTPNNLAAGANKIVSGLASAANSLGFDRIGSLISKGDVGNLFTASATTATYVGAALSGVRSITAAVNKNPNATDQDVAALSTIDSDLSAQNAVKQVESTRSATDSTATFVANTNAQMTQINQQGQTAMAIAAKYSSTEADSGSDVDTISGNLSDVTGNNFGELD
jgi:hypothetical protein